jgi:hypothetical protein
VARIDTASYADAQGDARVALDHQLTQLPMGLGRAAGGEPIAIQRG